MGRLIRKQFYISNRQEDLLKKKASELGITEAEIVREALDAHLEKMYLTKENPSSWQEERRFIQERISEANPQQHRKRDWKRDDLYDR